MEQVPLLQTKLHIPPVRPDASTPDGPPAHPGQSARTGRARLVSRPRLIERLNAGRDRKLTLVSAPAGFGKTTLVSDWVHLVGAQQNPEYSKDAASLQVAWLSLDESDKDPARFTAYLIAALRRVEAGIGKGTLSALQSPQPPPAGAALIPLINEIAAISARILLVIDDYHLIEAQPIHDALNFLLEHMPPQMHLVIATREDPPLPLGRLRAGGQLTELRAADLRFSSSEAADFLNQVMGLDLSVEEVAALEGRTEGWIAGLQLAALALQSAALTGRFSIQDRKDTSSLIESFTGSHRFVLDYLIEEILELQSEDVQAFLLQTSVLDRLAGPLCDAVRFGSTKAPSTPKGGAAHFGTAESPTGQDSGQATLEKLERANLFIIPLDEERRWYRYHHLFADLLRRRLGQTQPQRVPTLHHRASEWYEQNGFVDEAIEHALRADEFRRAADLVEEHVDALWQRGEHTKLRRWLAGLPDELLSSKPQLGIHYAWYLFARGQQDAGERTLQIAEEALEPRAKPVSDTTPPDHRDQLSAAERTRLRGRASTIRASMASYRGDAPAIIRHARQALDDLSEQDSTWRSIAAIVLGNAYGFGGDMAAAYQARSQAAEASKSAGNAYFSILAHLEVAITLREQGRLQRTIEICEQQLQLAGKSGLSQVAMAGCLLAIWGEALAEQGDLEGAKRQTKKGVELTDGGDLAMFGWSYLCWMRVLLSTGDLATAQETIQKTDRIDRESDVPPWFTNQMAAWQARLWLAQGNVEAASRWAETRGLLAAGDPEPAHNLGFFPLIESIVFARILIAQGRVDEANELLQQLLEAAKAGDRTTRAIEISGLQALALEAGADTPQAMAALERALIMAEPKGFLRIFVDEGPPMARLLHLLRRKGVAGDYVAQILNAFGTMDDGPGKTHDPTLIRRPQSPLVEPLSARELEVLQLIAEGLSNREIASRLFLSLNTVKAHTRNIYGKLGVRSRTQAVARARALAILPSD